jgi:hypothetical protein
VSILAWELVFTGEYLSKGIAALMQTNHDLLNLLDLPLHMELLIVLVIDLLPIPQPEKGMKPTMLHPLLRN